MSVRVWEIICQQELATAERFFGRSIRCVFQIDDRPGAFPKRRDFAYTDGSTVFFSPKITSAPPDRIRGLVRHEICHILFMQEGTAHSEVDADDLALVVFGSPIYYDDEDVQTVRPGVSPRPSHLPNPRE